jgi:hypothetical protein
MAASGSAGIGEEHVPPPPPVPDALLEWPDVLLDAPLPVLDVCA